MGDAQFIHWIMSGLWQIVPEMVRRHVVVRRRLRHVARW